jgi:hypothetical protein
MPNAKIFVILADQAGPLSQGNTKVDAACKQEMIVTCVGYM